MRVMTDPWERSYRKMIKGELRKIPTMVGVGWAKGGQSLNVLDDRAIAKVAREGQIYEQEKSTLLKETNHVIQDGEF